MHPLTGRPVRLGLLAAAGLLLAYACLREPWASRRLTSMLLHERFTAGRLAGQEAWEPCVLTDADPLVPRTRCGRPPQADTTQARRVRDALRAAREEIQGGSSATTLRAGALLGLRSANASPAHLDSAVARLEQARRRKPRSPVILNDLAVAYLELGERDQQLMPMLRALDAIERAFARESTRPSILYNRALILQRLYMLASADLAWKRYLAVERDPTWRAEAEAHARRLEAAVDTVSWKSLLRSPPAHMNAGARADIAARVRRSPQAAREFGFPLLGEWGTALERGELARAARLLALAREIGAAARALGLDQSVSLAVSAIDAAAGDSLRLRELSRGHVELERGYGLYNQALEARAAPFFERAERALRAAGSPAARWAAFYGAAAALNNVKYANGDRRLRDLLAESELEEPALVGKTLWALGLSQLRRGSYESAGRLYRQATPYIVRAREAENEGAVAVLLAEDLTLAGRPTDGQAEAFRALRMLSPFRRSTYLNSQLTIVASYARSEGLGYAALAVADEMVGVAMGIERPKTKALALCARMRHLIALRRLAHAQADLEQATSWAEKIEPGPGGDRVRAQVQLALGQVTRIRDPRAAIPLLAKAVATYSSFGEELYLPTALYEAALAARAVGKRAQARSWLLRAIEHVERQRASFKGTEDRAAFYETVENVFDEMIGIEMEEGRPEAGFRMLERGRIHAWSAEGRQASSTDAGAIPASLAGIGASLPEDMLFVEYALLPESIVIWTASRRGTKHHTVRVPRESVAALVEEFRRGASVSSPASAAARARLFDLLVRPLGRELGGIRQLTIVPDRELYRLPFAALWDRRAGRYVVERYRVRTVPSAAFYVTAAAKETRGPAGAGSALVVGNPNLDPALASTLPRLPGAAREARVVAGLYPGSVRLSGPAARRDSVVKLMPAHSIFHFSGHAVFNADKPELSYLALAPDRSGTGGILSAREIGGLSLSNVKVVVLSACSSLSPRASRTGAIAGLAYSFLRAGAPATISTLWDVDDGTTRELVVRFHRLLAAGTPAAEALRQAQIEALKSAQAERSAPESWAAFIYTGP